VLSQSLVKIKITGKEAEACVSPEFWLRILSIMVKLHRFISSLNILLDAEQYPLFINAGGNQDKQN
jgi:hypothetical protein